MNKGVTKQETDELMDISNEMLSYRLSQVYNLNKLIETLEIDKISFALQVCKGNKTQASKMLGLKRTCLLAKIKKYELV